MDEKDIYESPEAEPVFFANGKKWDGSEGGGGIELPDDDWG